MNKHPKVLIAGGTGLIGSKLAQLLENSGYNVSILTRNINKQSNYKCYYWNTGNKFVNPEALVGQDYIINLAGESIGTKYWTKKRKVEILDSRLSSIETLLNAIASSDYKPQKFIQASAIGYYGHRPNTKLTETDLSGKGFLADVCKQVEGSVNIFPIRVTCIRIGIVLAKEGGYLPQIQKILQSRLNVVMGNGKQIISWIHIDDLTNAIKYIIESEQDLNVYNLTSPKAETVKTIQKAIARYSGYNTIGFTIPPKLVKFTLGSFSELFLNDQDVFPKNLIGEGFKFKYEHIDEALSNLR